MSIYKTYTQLGSTYYLGALVRVTLRSDTWIDKIDIKYSLRSHTNQSVIKVLSLFSLLLAKTSVQNSQVTTSHF